jgi:hypothetical protein
LRRAYEAADVEDIDKLLPPPQPQQPTRRISLKSKSAASKALKDKADAGLTHRPKRRARPSRTNAMRSLGSWTLHWPEWAWEQWVPHPSSEDFAQWRDNPVTQWVCNALNEAAEENKAAWI